MDAKALFTILKCADSADGQLGRGGMLKMLLGRESRKLSKLRLDHADEYGSLAFMHKGSILEHIDYLIERGCLHVFSASKKYRVRRSKSTDPCQPIFRVLSRSL